VKQDDADIAVIPLFVNTIRKIKIADLTLTLNPFANSTVWHTLFDKDLSASSRQELWSWVARRANHGSPSLGVATNRPSMKIAQEVRDWVSTPNDKERVIGADERQVQGNG
jgi:hypothetical protein